MHLAELAVFMTLTWTGPKYPPGPFLNKDVRDNLKTEGPPTLGGTLGLLLLMILALISGISFFHEAYVCAIVALALFFVAAGLLASRNIGEASLNWREFLAGLLTAILGFAIAYFGEGILVTAIGASVLIIGVSVAFFSFWD